MSKKVKIFGLKALPIWLIVVALVAAGAGAAVGTILTGNVVAEIPVTISQALEVGKPVAAAGTITSSHVDNMPQAVDWLDGAAGISVDVVAPDRSIGAVNDEQTAFQFAAEIDQHDFYAFWLPLKNASNQDMVVEIRLNVPAGLTVEVMDADGSVVDNMCRTGLYTWKFDLDSSAVKTTPVAATGSDDSLFIVVAASDTVAPGFYTISGEIIQISY